MTRSGNMSEQNSISETPIGENSITENSITENMPGADDGLALRLAIGIELLVRCHDLGLTPGQLAARADVPLSTLKNILDGHSRNPGVLTLHALCGGLGVPLAEFIAAAQRRAGA